ncbi:hypothetical protein [Actinophytocola sp.]|uniref:hypothetical protein n=1 Tax=Actinophytocola sp. TaxID=1872138 RepID=UPI003D6A42D8
MKYDHAHCPPGAHDRDPGTSIEDGQPVDEHGLMLCRDCDAPLMYCATVEDYDHADSDTPPCFLVPANRDGGA